VAQLDEKQVIALQLLMMDARDGKDLASRALNRNVWLAVPEPSEPDDYEAPWGGR
jgi:hypothetical protein